MDGVIMAVILRYTLNAPHLKANYVKLVAATPNCLRQKKRSPKNLVFSNIRFMVISAKTATALMSGTPCQRR